MDVLLRNKKAPASIFLRQIKRIAHDGFSICSLNTKSFSLALMFIKSFMVNFVQLIYGNGAGRIFLFVMVRFDVNKDLIK